MNVVTSHQFIVFYLLVCVGRADVTWSCYMLLSRQNIGEGLVGRSHGGHPAGRPGKVMEYDISQGKVGGNLEKSGN